MSQSVPLRPFPWIGLIALGASSFSVVTVEVLPTGVLPQIARSLGTTEALVGTLISVFAFAVVICSPLLTQVTRRLPRKHLIVVSLSVAVAAGFAAAAAPSFVVLVAVRFVGGAAHGLFWSIVGAYPGYLVAPHQLGRAVAINSAGSSLSFVLGLPLGTWIGQTYGWRWAFVVISAIGLVALVIIIRFLPSARGAHERRGGRGEVPAVTSSVPIVTPSRSPSVVSESGEAIAKGNVDVSARHPADGGVRAVVILCATTAIYMCGSFAFSTYVAPLMRDVVGLPEGDLSGILLVQGAIGLLAVFVTGWAFAARPRFWLMLGMGVQVVFATVLWLVAARSVPAALIVFWSMALVGGALPMLLQVVLLRVAPERIRDVSLSFYTVSFNVGIGGGAALGAVIVEVWGVQQVMLANASLALVALVAYLSYTVPRARAVRRHPHPYS